MTCITLFRYKYPKELIFSIPNAGKRRFLDAVRQKKMGVVAGIPDLEISAPFAGYHGLYVELKIDGNFLTEEQAKRRAHLLSRGYCVLVCYNVREFESMVDWYFRGDLELLNRHIAQVNERVEAREKPKIRKVPNVRRAKKRTL